MPNKLKLITRGFVENVENSFHRGDELSQNQKDQARIDGARAELQVYKKSLENQAKAQEVQAQPAPNAQTATQPSTCSFSSGSDTSTN